MKKSTHTLEEIILAACLMEATAPKVGNVHPAAPFDDMTYDHFVKSAEVVAPVLSQCKIDSVGKTVLDAVQATHDKVGCNTNLGIILLLAPLVAVPASVPLKEGIQNVLQRLTTEDADYVYEAIRIANPGGMGEIDDGDIEQQPTGTLLEMMQLAATHDQIAKQYANGYNDLLSFGLNCVTENNEFMEDWKQSVVWLQLRYLEQYSDSHIIRKCGTEIGEVAQQRAANVLGSGYGKTSLSQKLLQEFDEWLRQDNNIRNPGTTADLITATLFIAFRERLLTPPEKLEIF